MAKSRAILKKRTDWRTVMYIESMKLHFFPMPNEQFPNVPDDFILMLCTPLGAKI